MFKTLPSLFINFKVSYVKKKKKFVTPKQLVIKLFNGGIMENKNFIIIPKTIFVGYQYLII